MKLCVVVSVLVVVAFCGVANAACAAGCNLTHSSCDSSFNDYCYKCNTPNWGPHCESPVWARLTKRKDLSPILTYEQTYGGTLVFVGSVLFYYGPAPGGTQMQMLMFSDKRFEISEIIPSQPQDQLPEPRRYHTAVVYNNLIIVAGGANLRTNDPLPSTSIWIYDTNTNLWARKDGNTYDKDARVGHVAFVYGDKMYLFGGQIISSTSLYDGLSYNILTETFARVFAPHNFYMATSVFYQGNKFYIAGSYYPYKYNFAAYTVTFGGANPQWSQVEWDDQKGPPRIYSHAWVTADGAYMNVFGGEKITNGIFSTVVKDIDQLSFSMRKWFPIVSGTNKDYSPPALMDKRFASTSRNGVLYVFADRLYAYGPPCPSTTDNNCFECPPGYYLGLLGLCVECGVGTFSNQFSRTTNCDENICPAGSAASGASPECEICQPGTYQDEIKQPTCKPCGPGRASLETNRTVPCDLCEMGYVPTDASSICSICTNNTYANNDQTECSACPEGSVSEAGSFEINNCKCISGKVVVGNRCNTCPIGADCTTGVPIPQSGYWNAINSTGQIFRCVVAEACPGGSLGVCAPGYDTNSIACSQCSKNFFLLQNRCRECPTPSYGYMLALGLLFFVLLVVMYYLMSKGITFPALQIAFRYFQLLAICIYFKLDWPPELLEFFRAFSFFNFEINAAGPECAIQIPFYTKWLVVLLVPLGLGFLLLLLRMCKCCCQKNTVYNKATATWIMLLKLLYLQLTTRALAAFDCTKQEYYNDENVLVRKFTLTSNTEITCWTYVGDGGISYDNHYVRNYLVPSVFLFAFYGLGVPIYFARIISRGYNQDKFEDTDFEARYGSLYNELNWKYFVIETLVIQLIFAMISMFAVNNPEVQAGIAIGVYFIFSIRQILLRPYKEKLYTVTNILNTLLNLLTVIFGFLFLRVVTEDSSPQYKATLACSIIVIVLGIILNAVVNIYKAIKYFKSGGNRDTKSVELR